MILNRCSVHSFQIQWYQKLSRLKTTGFVCSKPFCKLESNRKNVKRKTVEPCDVTTEENKNSIVFHSCAPSEFHVNLAPIINILVEIPNPTFISDIDKGISSKYFGCPYNNIRAHFQANFEPGCEILPLLIHFSSRVFTFLSLHGRELVEKKKGCSTPNTE